MGQHLSQLYSEHSSIAAVLGALSSLVKEVRDHGRQVNPEAFRAIVYYLDVFPEREHHHIEETVLFPRIRQRTHAADDLLDQLTAEHALGERAIRDLEQAFVRYEERGASEFPAFAAAAEVYVDRYRDHMRTEEQRVMPIAERVLVADDWAAVEAAFASHRDPLQGVGSETDADRLFQRIVMLVPAPYGLGAAIDSE